MMKNVILKTTPRDAGGPLNVTTTVTETTYLQTVPFQILVEMMQLFVLLDVTINFSKMF